jgi:predicted dehydrogenase
MYSVGILSEQAKWSEVLSEMLKTTGSRVSGWVNPQESSPLITRQLIDFSDVVWIPEKMSSGMDEAIQVIRSSRHLSLGFPIDEFMEEAPFMVKLAHEARIQVQIGHHDWHNPAFRSSLSLINQPQTIRINESIPELLPAEGHHQVFKAILTNLDLAMGLSGSTVRKVRPHASRLNNGTAIEVNTRVEMHNGSVISLNIRKFAPVPNRTIEIIQSNGIILIDLLNGTSHYDEYLGTDESISVSRKILWPPSGDNPVLVRTDRPGDQEMARQCLSFIHALNRGQYSLSGLEGGFNALELAQQIETNLGSL